MFNFLSYRTAGFIQTITLGILVVFHLLTAFGVLPKNIIWADRVSAEDVKTYELITAGITGLLLFFALIKAQFIEIYALERIANSFAWVTVIYSLMMTAEITSERSLSEQLIFVPISIILFVSSLRLARERK